MTLVDYRFVSASLPSDTVVLDPSVELEWRQLFDREIDRAWRFLAMGEWPEGHARPERVSDVFAWLQQMREECWMPHRTILVKRPVRIGRRGHGLAGYFGNPYSDGTRHANVRRFREYFANRIETDPEYKRRILELRGKRLGCFCPPLLCHGDVIAAWLDVQP